MNWNIFGHEWAVQLLKQHVINQTQRHAYLFTGPESVGRRTLALRFAQALNCPQSGRTGEPCLECPTCDQLGRLVHPDLSIVQAEKVGGQLKVDQIRDLQHGLALAPIDANYRIALLLRFEQANKNAANALLKTLEEPPTRVVVMLTAESAERLMPTIVSRCEILRLRPLPIPDMKQGLITKRNIPPTEADLIAHLSGGRPGYCVRLLREPEELSLRNAWLDDLQSLITANRVERFYYAETMARENESLRYKLKVWLSFWRDVMLRISNSSAPITNIDRMETINEFAQKVDLSEAHQLVISLERIFDLLDHNVNRRLALEVLMLDIPSW
jgi:DNA polymerase-3 subunit delta'